MRGSFANFTVSKSMKNIFSYSNICNLCNRTWGDIVISLMSLGLLDMLEQNAFKSYVSEFKYSA